MFIDKLMKIVEVKKCNFMVVVQNEMNRFLLSIVSKRVMIQQEIKNMELVFESVERFLIYVNDVDVV